MSRIAELKAYKGMLAMRLLHGRKDPDEDMEEQGFHGPVLFFDSMYLTYNSAINLVYGCQSTGPMTEGPDTLTFYKDMIALHDEDGITYYGDYEICPASTIRHLPITKSYEGVTPDMAEAGNKIASELMDATVSHSMGGAGGSRTWNEYVEQYKGTDLDLIQQYVKHEIDAVTAIYSAMARAKK